MAGSILSVRRPPKAKSRDGGDGLIGASPPMALHANEKTFSSTVIGDLLANASIAPRVSAASKRQALSIVSEIAARALSLRASEVFDALMGREAAGPTGVGRGVALPHAHVDGLDRLHGIFVRLEAPVDFGAVDDEPVDLLFTLLAPRDGGSEHLRAMARVSRLLREADVRQQLRSARGADAIHALLARDDPPYAARVQTL